MKKYIAVTDKQRAAIFSASKVGERTIRNALNFDPIRGSSKKAVAIREIAHEHGAKTFYNEVAMEEVFFDSEGNLRQEFENGAKILIEKGTGKASVTYKGDTVIQIENIKISEITTLQEVARGL